MGEGQFHCPRCDARRQYHHRKSQQWFTLYFLPVFPIKTYGEYVECQSCGGTFDTQVLAYDPSQAHAAREAQIHGLWRAALMSVAGAFGQPSAERVAAALSGLVEPEDADAFAQDMTATPRDGVQREEIAARFAALAEPLSIEGKERLFRAAVRTARVDAVKPEETDGLLIEIGRALGLSDAHAHGVMTS
jgi:hypothetical protein